MNDVIVVVEAEVKPTEDVDKVKKAVEYLFPDAEIELKIDCGRRLLIAAAEGANKLAFFRDRLRHERTLDAARRILLRGVRGNRITFYLNKQVAYVKHISFCEASGESPLGPVKVEVKCSNPRELISWLTGRLQ